MRSVIFVLILIGALLFGCTNPNNPGQGNGTGVYPPGYENRTYCNDESDCVRLYKCCDCGAGEYVNKYHQETPVCTGPKCMCPIMESKAGCKENKCVTIPVVQPPAPTGPFCGSSTEGACVADSDCTSGGCSGQICQSISEKPVVTTCEYSECYNAASYGFNCGCVEGKCKWR